MKKRVKMLIVLLMFLPGFALIAAGAIIAWTGRAAIENAETGKGTVARVYKRIQRDIDGKIERDAVSVSFVAKDGKESTFESEVFSTMFLSAGDEVKVLYDPRDPKKARLSAGFFAEPYAVVFCVLFGAFWLAIPSVLIAIVKWPRRQS